MKDLPHHMKKLNRRVVRSVHRLELEDEQFSEKMPNPPSERVRPKAQLRKQAKAKMKKERLARTPSVPTAEEKNKKMKDRVPVFDRLSHQKRGPKVGARSSKKKRPRV